MKRKLTDTQVAESLDELTDDVTDLKDGMQAINANQVSFERRIAAILEVLDQAATTVHETAMNQLRYEQEAKERMARSDERTTQVEASVQKLSDTVDRYLSARLNGGSQN